MIKWYNVATTGDCLDSDTTWNNLIEYVQHSKCTDFTIHSTCTNIGQAFRFTQTGTDSQMYGGDDVGDDLHIWGNDNASAVNIAFLNTGEFKIFDGATEAFKFRLTGVNSYLEGGLNAGDMLRLKGTSTNPLPQIALQGGFHITYDVQANKKHMFLMGSVTFLELYETGTDDVIEGKTAGNDLYLKPVGVVKFGTYNAKGAEVFDGFIPIKDNAGNNRKLMTCA